MGLSYDDVSSRPSDAPHCVELSPRADCGGAVAVWRLTPWCELLPTDQSWERIILEKSLSITSVLPSRTSHAGQTRVTRHVVL